jgi:flagellar FliL protein
MNNLLKYILTTIIILAILGGLHLAGFISIGSPTVDAAQETKATAKAAAVPLYLPLDPPFVVNFQHRGALHYLQLELQLMYHDQKIIDRIVANMPAVRNELILLFSNQEFDSLITSEGKELLRARILDAVNGVAGVEPDRDTGDIDGKVYITHFVMQ